MDPPWSDGSQQAQELPNENVISYIQSLQTYRGLDDDNTSTDIEATRRCVESGINRLAYDPDCGIDTYDVILMHTAVYKYCMSEQSVSPYNPRLAGENLYHRLVKWVCDYVSVVKQCLMSQLGSDIELVKLYINQLTSYARIAKYIYKVFRYLHRSWLKREHELGNPDVHNSHELQLLIWSNELTLIVMGAISRLEKQHGDRTIVFDTIKLIVHSLYSLNSNFFRGHTTSYGADVAQFLSQVLAAAGMEGNMRQLSLNPNNTNALNDPKDNIVLKLYKLGEPQVADCYTAIKVIFKELDEDRF